MIPRPNSVLVFYKVSCPTCKLTLPFLHRINRPVLGISQDDQAATDKFTRDFSVQFPSILDAAEENYPLSNDYGIQRVPTLFVMDQHGKVVERIEGFDKEALENLGVVFGSDEPVPEFKPG